MSEKDNEKAAPAVQIPVADLRDYFAAHVMNAMLSNFEWMKHCANESGLPGELSIPIMSYEIADAMLKERAK